MTVQKTKRKKAEKDYLLTLEQIGNVGYLSGQSGLHKRAAPPANYWIAYLRPVQLDLLITLLSQYPVADQQGYYDSYVAGFGKGCSPYKYELPSLEEIMPPDPD